MTFANEAEAKHFLVGKIAARATLDGSSLSDSEREMLNFSAAQPPPGAPGDQRLDPDDFGEGFGEKFEGRMATLLRQAYDRDASSDSVERQMYRDALAILRHGDHYISWIAERAGLRPPLPPGLRLFKQAALLGLLVFPALVALVIAGSGVWAALGKGSRSGEGTVGMSVVALVFAGFAAFLLALWWRERRPS
jgi:hypothetical protein